MRYMAVFIIVICISACFAVEYNAGIDGAAGIGISRWKGEFYNFEGVYITDHLDSKEPIYQAGLALNIWFTGTFGIHTGVQYGWYNYSYTYESAADTLGSEWNYSNVLIPLNLMYGIPVAGNRLVIGAGAYICKELSGSAPDFDVPDDLLEITAGPAVLLGYEIQAGNLCVFPSFRYINGIDGMSDRLVAPGAVSYQHYLMLGVGLLYRL